MDPTHSFIPVDSPGTCIRTESEHSVSQHAAVKLNYTFYVDNDHHAGPRLSLLHLTETDDTALTSHNARPTNVPDRPISSSTSLHLSQLTK